MINKKIFKDVKGNELLIKGSKSSITFELTNDNNKDYNFNFLFNNDTFEEVKKYLIFIGKNNFVNFNPFEATSESSDYYEYYDKKFDSNGYMEILLNGFSIERPSIDSRVLYKFNKRRFESFIYDLNKTK